MSTMARIDGTPGPGNGMGALVACWRAEVGLEKFELLFALVASHAARFLTNDVFSQKDKGKGWKGESGEGQVRKRRNKAKLSLQK